ncbi:hypothetical protein BJ912DRAFT_1075237 [Pholiota molesta]|nr:hypothetical protein BJ912DRAFT_1075237 [Pholiota molesta]
MLIVLLIFALIRTLRGVPLASPSDSPDPFPVLTLRDTQTHFGQRTVNDIVISCFATIFACTWSAIHPNIPAVTDSKWTCFKRQVTITICALLTPELVTLWAIQQRIAAKEIMDEYNKDINHLTLDSGRKTSLEKFKGWFQAIFCTICGVFQDSPLPAPLKEGKGPQWTLAHGFFLQMGGFMLCESGRPIQTLRNRNRTWLDEDDTSLIWNIQQEVIDPPRITEEDIQDRSKGDAISKRLLSCKQLVVTLGFAMLNGITYGLWWDKPQNVGRPVFFERKKTREETSVERSTAGNSTSEDTETESNPLLPQAEPGKESWLRWKLRQEIEDYGDSPNILWRLPFLIVRALFRPLWKMVEDDTVTTMRVGMFYAAEDIGEKSGFATMAIGALFGSKCGFGGFLAIIITAAPVLMGIIALCDDFDQGFLGYVFLVFASVGLILYPTARIILLTLSLTALRSLPPGALQTIEWTTFIPHL